MKSGLLIKALVIGLPVLIVVAVVGIAAIAVAIAMVRSARLMRAVSAQTSPAMIAPPAPPAVERWAAGAYAIWTGGEDCGTWPAERAQTSLASWYGATDATRLQSTIDGLLRGTTGNAAWDQVRAIDLLRIGTAAGFLTQAQCWEQVRTIAGTLRRQYRSWEALAEGFEAGMNAWHDTRGVTDPQARGRVARNLGALRGQIWPAIPYDAAL